MGNVSCIRTTGKVRQGEAETAIQMCATIQEVGEPFAGHIETCHQCINDFEFESYDSPPPLSQTCVDNRLMLQSCMP